MQVYFCNISQDDLAEVKQSQRVTSLNVLKAFSYKESKLQQEAQLLLGDRATRKHAKDC